MALDPAALIGTWRLVSCESRNAAGEVRYPYGERPAGYLTYTPDGFMFGTLSARDRRPFASDGPIRGTPDEWATAGREYLAYCGRYSIHGDTVTHHVELSLFPNWIGGDQQRFVHLDGDRLTISTPTSATLVWERAT